MSNLVCLKCGSSRIVTERRLDGFHYCMDCRHRWKIGESQPKPTVFDQITASPETLAEASVYQNYIGLWCSPFIQWGKDTRAEAHAATVAKLKEACND